MEPVRQNFEQIRPFLSDKADLLQLEALQAWAEASFTRLKPLLEQRKAQGYRRITLWLSPEQVNTLEVLGGEPWLGSTVRAWLESAVAECQRQPARQAVLFANASNDSGPASPLPDNDKAALWREADSLNKAGLSWNAIARRWNEQGQRIDKGAVYRGANIARGVRKWKGEG